MLPLYIVLGIIVLFVAIAATRPTDFRIERSARIDGPPQAIFDQVNDFHNWKRWSPWAKIDPAMRVTYGGEPAGVGATYAWAGNAKAGEGRMEIVESRPFERVKILLDFVKPFRASNVTVFRMEREGSGTCVTWCMAGKRNFGMKAFGLFVNMDKMVGGDFEKGLAELKAIAEAQPVAAPASETGSGTETATRQPAASR